jgi:hypothetical protein
MNLPGGRFNSFPQNDASLDNVRRDFRFGGVVFSAAAAGTLLPVLEADSRRGAQRTLSG